MRKLPHLGISDHGGWAILVAATPDGKVLLRRRVELLAEALPKLPFHHDAQGLPLPQAEALIEAVRHSAEQHARLAVETVLAELPNLAGLALRRCPALPPTVAERLRDNHARNNADWVLYREALAAAAKAHELPVAWFDSKTVSREASAILGISDFEAYFQNLRASMGPPWNADHKLALAAALASAYNRFQENRAARA